MSSPTQPRPGGSADLADLGKMCAAVAHEVRNPLAGMKAVLQSLDRERAPPEFVEPLEMMEHEVDRLVDLLDGFFRYLRLPTPQKQWTDIHDVIGRAHKSVAPKLAGVAFERDFCATGRIYADPRQLQQVFINLLLNSAEAMPMGGTIYARTQTQGPDLLITLRDQGAGVALGDREHMLEPFFTTKSGGTGLGLAISQRAVHQHAGSLAFEWPPEGGTKAMIQLPLTPEMS